MKTSAYNSVTVTATPNYPTDPQVALDFRPVQIDFALEAAAGAIVFYSFDGTTNDGCLTSSAAQAYLGKHTRQCGRRRLWFKTAAVGAVVVHLHSDGDERSPK